MDDGELDAAEGVYALPAGDRFEVVRADGGLVVTPTGRTALEALLPLTVTPAEVEDHEAAVAAMLAGETAAGADEVAIPRRTTVPCARWRCSARRTRASCAPTSS